MKRVVISSVLTLLIILLVGLGFYYYNKSSLFKSDPIAAIPPDAPFVFKSNQAGKSFDLLTKNEAWNSLQSGGKNGSIVFLDSLFRTSAELSTAWEHQVLYLSVHVTKAANFDVLFLMNTNADFSDGAIENLVEHFTGKPSLKRRYENVTIREATVGSGNLAYATSNGVFIASFTSFLVEDAIRQLKTGTSIAKTNAFKKADVNSQNSELTCYINYQGLASLAANYGSANADVLVRYIGNLASWSALDANVQIHSILMNGLTEAGDAGELASVFRNQFPVENKLGDLVPDRTAFILDYGFSDAKGFFDAARKIFSMYDDSLARKSSLQKLSRKYHTDVENKMTSWISNNMALVITEPGNQNFSNNSFLCLETLRADDAKKKLESLRAQINKTDGTPDKQESYRNHAISFLNLPDVASLVYGKLFSRMTKFYYTTIRNYVVVGNTASALRSFIDDYEDGKSLSHSRHGKDALTSLSNTHNVFMYMHLPAMQNISKTYALPQEHPSSPDENSLLQAFTSLTFSLRNQSSGMLTSVLWSGQPEVSKGIRLIASAKLDTTILMQPCVFAVTGEAPTRIAVQDANNNFYLLDETGEVLWKRAMNEKIMGNIYPVDYFKNGDVQLLYNTASALHLIDLSGQYVGNYPIRTPSSAVTGLTMLPADEINPSRIFVYCLNGLIYAYELSGKPLSTWLYNTSFSNAEHPLVPLSIKGKNLLLLYNAWGVLAALDESGNELKPWGDLTLKGIKREIKTFYNDSIHEQVAVIQDSAGMLHLLSANGKMSTYEIPVGATFDFNLSRYQPGYKSIYSFLTADSLLAFDENKTRLFSIRISNKPDAMFQPFAANGENASIVLLNGESKIYNVSNAGLVADGFPVKGSTKIGMLKNAVTGKTIWVTGDTDGSVYVYELK